LGIKKPGEHLPFEHVFDPEGAIPPADLLIGTRAWSPQELSDDPNFFQKQKRGGRRALIYRAADVSHTGSEITGRGWRV